MLLAPPVVTTLQLGNGTYGSPYSETITAGGGTGSYTSFTLVGTLPVGLTFNRTSGLISGTPTGVTGPIELKFTVSDSGDRTSVIQVLYLTIAPAPLTINAPDRSVIYGAAVPDLTPKSYLGFVNDDTASSVFGSNVQCSTTYVAGTPVAASGIGITCTNLSSGAYPRAGNYSITYVAGSILISPAPLTATGPTHSVTYGSAIPDLAAQISGYVAGDDALKVFGSAAPQCSTAYTAATQVAESTLAAPCSNLTAANYTITQTPGSITVTPAALTITAPNHSLVYGDPQPSLIPDYAGFVGSDTAAMFGARECTTTYFAGHPVGQSPVGCSGFTAANYQISYVAGEITIGRATITVVAPILTVAAGSEIPVLNPGLEGFRNSETTSVISKLPICTTTYTPRSPGNAS